MILTLHFAKFFNGGGGWWTHTPQIQKYFLSRLYFVLGGPAYRWEGCRGLEIGMVYGSGSHRNKGSECLT